MKKLTAYTDREIALMLGALHRGLVGKHDALVAEAAYRLVRAGGGQLSVAESQLIDEIHTYDFRMRDALRAQRRLRIQQKQIPRQGLGMTRGEKVISIGTR